MCMQVVNYVLTKPAREALFTVVSPEERYKGKLCMDTVIVRLGDTVAAGLFQVLEGFLHVGEPSGAIFLFHISSGKKSTNEGKWQQFRNPASVGTGRLVAHGRSALSCPMYQWL